MDAYVIAECLSYKELLLLAGDVEDVAFYELSVSDEERYDKLNEAWARKQEQSFPDAYRNHYSPAINAA